MSRDDLIFTLCSVFLLIATPANASTLSLSEAVRIAREDHPELKRVEAQRESAAWKKSEMLAVYAPKFNLRFDHTLLHRYQIMNAEFSGRALEIPATYPLSTLSLEGNWLLFDGIGGWNSFRAAALEEEAARLQQLRAGFQVEQEVRARYFQAVAARFLAAVARQNIQTLEEHLNDIRSRVQAGVATRFDFLRVEVQLEDARTELISAEDHLVLTRQRLAQTLALSSEELPTELSDPLPVPEAKVESDSLRLEAGRRDDLQALTLRENATEKQRDAARAHWYPRFSIFGNRQSYNNLNSSMTDRESYRSAYNVGFSLSWNLFDGGASVSRQKQAFYRSEEMRYGLDAALLQAQADFTQQKRRFYYSIAQYQARLRSIGKAEESVRLARIGVKAGTRTHTELLDAELDLMKTRAGVIRAQADALETRLALESALGRKLD